MTKKPSPAFSPSRRATLKTASLALCAGMLPFAPSWGAAAGQGARYRRYNVSDSRMGARMLASYARAVRAMLARRRRTPETGTGKL
jgi:tyrosinase